MRAQSCSHNPEMALPRWEDTGSTADDASYGSSEPPLSWGCTSNRVYPSLTKMRLSSEVKHS